MKHLAALLKTKKAIVFDLDGTLMHTEPEIRMAINGALHQYGYPTLDTNTPLPNLHGTSREVFESAVALTDVKNRDIAAIHLAYTKHYIQQGHAHSALYPGVLALLEHLKEHDYKLAVCTNKNETNAHHALTAAGIINFFPVITGGDTTDHPKPHPMPLTYTLAQLGISHHQAVLIGDTHIDAQCAERCSVDFILHQNGYGDPKESEYKIAGQFKTYENVFDSLLCLNELDTKW